MKVTDTLPGWAAELADLREGDDRLDSGLPGPNVVLNRARLASFLADFAEDRDVRDFLALDLIGSSAGLPLTSTGAAESAPSLVVRPFRLWEYVWIYKTLGLWRGGLQVLDLGGPGTHLSLLAAFAGSAVTSVDINPDFVEAARASAQMLRLNSLVPVAGDMRDLGRFPNGSFDAVMSCSVLEHLTDSDQKVALQEMARVLKPGGLVGLTFDYGPSAGGANEYLPPPHEPPPNAAAAVSRYQQGGLTATGNAFSEDPVPGCLFHDEVVRYTVASMFLAKGDSSSVQAPRTRAGESVLRSLALENLPFKIYGAPLRVRERELRVPYLEAVLDGERRKSAMLEEGLASTEGFRQWLLGEVRQYEAERWKQFAGRWYRRWKRRRAGASGTGGPTGPTDRGK